jgi:hypothetical protein
MINKKGAFSLAAQPPFKSVLPDKRKKDSYEKYNIIS